MMSNNTNNNFSNSSISLSPPPPFIPNQQEQNQRKNQYRSPIYFPTTTSSSSPPKTNEGELVKHDISTLVSLKARQIDDLEQKLENLNRDLKDSDELRIKWMERCSLLEEQLVEEAQSHTRELAASNQNSARYKSELQFIMRKLKEEDDQEDFLESIGAVSLLEDVRKRKMMGMTGGADETNQHQASSLDEQTNNFYKKRFSLSPERVLKTKIGGENDDSHFLLHHQRPAVAETATSISPQRFKSNNRANSTSSPASRTHHRSPTSSPTSSPSKMIKEQNNNTNTDENGYYSPSQVFQSRPLHFFPPHQRQGATKNQKENDNQDDILGLNSSSFNNTIITNIKNDSADCFSPSSPNNNNNQESSSSHLLTSPKTSLSGVEAFLEYREAKKRQSPQRKKKPPPPPQPQIQFVDRPKPPMADSETSTSPVAQKVNFFTQIEESYFPQAVIKRFTDTKIQTDMIPQKSAGLQTEDLIRVRVQTTQTNDFDTEADRELEKMRNMLKNISSADSRRARRDEDLANVRKGGRSSTSNSRRKNTNTNKESGDEEDSFFENNTSFGTRNLFDASADQQQPEDEENKNRPKHQHQDASTSFWHKALLSSPDALSTHKKNMNKEKNGVAAMQKHANFSASSPDRNYDRIFLQNQFTTNSTDLHAELLELRATVGVLKKELTEAKRQNFDYREEIRKMKLIEKKY